MMDECSNHFLFNVGLEFSAEQLCELLVKAIVNSGQTKLDELALRKKLQSDFSGIYYYFCLSNISFLVFRPEIKSLLNYVNFTNFFNLEDDKLATELMVRLVREAYRFVRVSGVGFGFVPYERERAFTEVTERHREKMLYWHEVLLYDEVWSVNLFCPVDVARLGREKLLGAPCELIEEWEDGAVFMMIHKDTFLSSFEERERLRKYLGGGKR